MGRLDGPHADGRLLLLAADMLTVLLLTVGTVLSFLSAYDLRTDTGAVLVFCGTASVVSAALHSMSRPWWSLGTAAAIAAVFWWMWEESLPVLQWIGHAMGLPGPYLAWSSRWEERLLPVLLLLCAAMTWLLGWAAVRARRWYLSALLTLLPVLPAIQSGVLPAWGAVLAAFAGWGAMLLTALYSWKDPGGLGRARLLSLAGMAALLLALTMALPREGYRRPQWATDARTALIRGTVRTMERFFDMNEATVLTDLGLDLSIPGEGAGFAAAEDESGPPGTFDGGPGRREDLQSAGPRRFQGQQIMRLHTDQPDPAGRVYLLGGTMDRYTGNSWESREPVGDSPGSLPAQTAPEVPSYTMTIKASQFWGTWYYPYRFVDGGTLDESGRLTDPVVVVEAAEDGPYFLDVSGAEEYQITYRPGGPEDGFTGLPDPWADFEDVYRLRAADRYLAVPGGLWEVLEPLLELLTRQSEPPAPGMPACLSAPVAAASRTAALLSELAAYDLNAPAMEPGEDFVEHFLAERKGYCVHFATAGVMLLRMQGIPARYAAGYVVELDSQGQGRVMDSDAHAWAEIYLDGYGWYPVEMTPGYTGGESGVELSGSPQAPEPDLPPEREQEPEALPVEPDSPEESAPPSDGEEDMPENGQEEMEKEPEDVDWGGALRTAARLALTLGGLGGAYGLALLPRRMEKQSRDTGRSVIAAYRRYRRTLRWSGAEDEELEMLGRKAKFSQHTLTEEERRMAWERLDASAAVARSRQKKWKRWILILLRPIL